MTELLEQVIQQLLVPDSEAIKQATIEIRRLMKDPAIVKVSRHAILRLVF